jgi:hypothetical protein
MSTVPAVDAYRFPVELLPYSITFAPDKYPSGLVDLESRDLTSDPPLKRYGIARRKVLSAILAEIRLVCASAVIQSMPGHPRHGEYMRTAAMNRARIARDTTP